MAAHASGVLLILQAKRTRRPQVQQALRRLGQSRAHLLGAVLTRYVAPRVSYGYGYGYDNYGYGYGFDYGANEEPALTDRILKLSPVGRRGRRLGRWASNAETRGRRRCIQADCRRGHIPRGAGLDRLDRALVPVPP